MSIILRTLGGLTNKLGFGLNKFGPEPRSRSTFTNTLNDIGSALGGAVPEGLSSVDGQFAALIQQQLEAQRQMQIVSFISNNEKSKHETQMAAIRNIRVG